ncbi:hypothetical protein PIB30_059002 [Stylosanthes scabra]|uniref:Uncharacterized protein n=1 Tax=Stylosanthes scabra TaxID=79078 RepID=A0ABU6XI52_9FABA|nr:hypothetical protein [Stylosanthes scabra]
MLNRNWSTDLPPLIKSIAEKERRHIRWRKAQISSSDHPIDLIQDIGSGASACTGSQGHPSGRLLVYLSLFLCGWSLGVYSQSLALVGWWLGVLPDALWVVATVSGWGRLELVKSS